MNTLIRIFIPLLVIAALLPYYAFLPVAIVLTSVAFITLYIVLQYLTFSPLHKAILLIFVLFSWYLLFQYYGIHFTRQWGIALLTLMLSLKFLEIKAQRDQAVIIFLSCFLIGTQFLFKQDIFTSIYACILTLISLYLLLNLQRQNQALSVFSWQQSKTILLHLVLPAIPLTLVLFLFFPRIPGALWTLPTEQQTRTGLSDSIFPGEISELVKNNDIAFRINFHGDTLPTKQQLYWRGPVMSITDGFEWKVPTVQHQYHHYQKLYTPQGTPIDYTITLEATQKKWLFSLEMPTQLPLNSYLTADLQLRHKHAITQVKQYTMRSYPQYTTRLLTAKERQHNLMLPPNSAYQARQLGRKWRRQLSSDKKIIQTALAYFTKEKFYYTLRPNIMEKDPIDEFLFTYRRGFCSHYASSFVILMRAAHIPARMVTGYQGIEYNPIGKYYLVRQSNAHAWAEVWLEKQGWIRVDPTAMIPPDRIEADVLENLEQLNFSQLAIPQNMLNSIIKSNFWQTLRQQSDYLHYLWNNWLLGYDNKQQLQLLTQLGLQPDWKNLILLLVGSVTAIFLFAIFLLYYQQRKQLDPLVVAYQQLKVKLVKAGISCPDNKGTTFIAQQIQKQLPHLYPQINSLLQCYVQLRYQSVSQTTSRIKAFSQQVQALTIR